MTDLSVEEISAAISATHGDDMIIRYCPDVLTDAVHHVYIYSKKWDSWGFGDGSDPRLAVTKAYFECVERITYKHVGAPTTNGFAAHVDFENASAKANAELVERDVFLATWFAKIPPVWLSAEQVDGLLDPLGRECLDLLRATGVLPAFGVCGVSNGFVVTVGLLDGRRRSSKPFGFTALPGVGTQIEVSLRNLILDLMRINTGIDTKGQETAAFKARRINGNVVVGETFDHLDYFLDLANSAHMTWYSEKSSSEAPVLPDLIIKTEEIAVPVATAFPLSVARAISPDAQDYFVGSARDERLNWERLAKLGVVKGQLLPLVHPIP